MSPCIIIAVFALASAAFGFGMLYRLRKDYLSVLKAGHTLAKIVTNYRQTLGLGTLSCAFCGAAIADTGRAREIIETGRFWTGDWHDADDCLERARQAKEEQAKQELDKEEPS